MTYRVILYLVHRYVLDELADHCPGSSLSDVDLLQVKTVGVWKRQSCDDTSDAQVQARHVHVGFIATCLLRLCFLPCSDQRETRAVIIIQSY